MKCGKINAKLIGILILILLIVIVIKNINVSEKFSRFNDDDIGIKEQIEQYNLFQKKKQLQDNNLLLESEKKEKMQHINDSINKLMQKFMLYKQLI